MNLLGGLEYEEVEFLYEYMGFPVGAKIKILKQKVNELLLRDPSPIRVVGKSGKIITEDENVEEKQMKKEDIKNRQIEAAPKNKMITGAKNKSATKKNKGGRPKKSSLTQKEKEQENKGAKN